MAMGDREDLPASLGVVVSGVLWGLFWMPFRELGEAGLGAAWASLAFYLGSTLALAPVAVARRRALRAGGIPLFLTGALAGAGFSLYATALLLTEVVRVLLLFYLTPVWGTLLAWCLLGERITPARALALVMGLAGLVVILGFEGGFPVPRSSGDWLALAAGIAWAYGSMRVYGARETHVFETGFAFFAGGSVVTALTLLVPGAGHDALPTPEALAAAAGWIALIVGLFGVPPVLLTLWGAARLNPGRVGLLLMGEVVVGIASAAVWSGEPFGRREALGTILVVGAGLIEVLSVPGTGRSSATRKGVPPGA